MSRIFAALDSVPVRLAHPNLIVEIVVTVEEEIRAVNQGWSRPFRGQVSLERRLLDLVAIHAFASMADLVTTQDIATAMKPSRRLGQQAAFCFREAVASEVCAKNGNALVYRRVARPPVS